MRKPKTMNSESMLDLLRDYRDNRRDPAWLNEKLVEYWGNPEWDVPLYWALTGRIFDWDDGFCTKDFIDGMVEGALEMIAPRQYVELDPKTNKPAKTISTGVMGQTKDKLIAKSR